MQELSHSVLIRGTRDNLSHVGGHRAENRTQVKIGGRINGLFRQKPYVPMEGHLFSRIGARWVPCMPSCRRKQFCTGFLRTGTTFVPPLGKHEEIADAGDATPATNLMLSHRARSSLCCPGFRILVPEFSLPRRIVRTRRGAAEYEKHFRVSQPGS